MAPKKESHKVSLGGDPNDAEFIDKINAEYAKEHAEWNRVNHELPGIQSVMKSIRDTDKVVRTGVRAHARARRRRGA